MQTDPPSSAWRSPAGLLGAALGIGLLHPLHLMNRRDLQRSLRGMQMLGRRVPGLTGQPTHVVAGLRIAARVVRMTDTSCLPRSQLAWVVLSWCGHDVTLRVGLRDRPSLHTPAHAWVEVDGRPIGEASNLLERHPPFDQPLLPMTLNTDAGTFHDE